jgi:hypothetical protein
MTIRSCRPGGELKEIELWFNNSFTAYCTQGYAVLLADA